MSEPDVPEALRLAVSTVEVPQDAYPTEVMCRKCRHLMLPADAEGRGWECWVCSRRIEIVLKGSPS
ncbi:MAG: endonuclease Q family protein [Planctomycetes bacterium]|nr:endonuclease Q family protein [Planctomycetota bacterium]